MRADQKAVHKDTRTICATLAARPSSAAPFMQVPSSSVTQEKPLQPWKWSKPRPQSKMAAASTPQAPAAPCTAKASMGSSICSIFSPSEAAKYTAPPIMAMKQALPHSTLPHPAVIDTRPAKMPLHIPAMSYFFLMTYRITKTLMPPLAAAMVVFIATCAAINPVAMSLKPRVEPQLKPYHPNQRIRVPNTTKGKLCAAK
mmetsp:Transcript_80694/g.164241  ORF Transcript_80694/g.164241 Transcript_80694/m.164241 type:complete len:200 (-) Transcript_80694:895-1494(-)